MCIKGMTWQIACRCLKWAVAQCRFPASADPAVFAAQKTLVEAHQIIEEAYVDGRFGGHDWKDELSTALTAAYSAESGDKAYAQIGRMLEKLGDPFTRIVPASCAPLFLCQAVASLIAFDAACKGCVTGVPPLSTRHQPTCIVCLEKQHL